MLWQRLYGMVWLSFFACAFVPGWMGRAAGAPVHGVLGVAVLLLAIGNARALAGKAVPDRLRRISRVTAGLSVFQAVIGGGLGALHLVNLPPVVRSIGAGVHLVVALAILAQSASVATSYDMWEEREFEPGPPAPPAADPGAS